MTTPRWRATHGLIFVADRYAGRMSTPELAAQVVAALNAREAGIDVQVARARQVAEKADLLVAEVLKRLLDKLLVDVRTAQPAPPAAPAVPGEGTVVSACCGASMQGNNDWCCACDRFARPVCLAPLNPPTPTVPLCAPGCDSGAERSGRASDSRRGGGQAEDTGSSGGPPLSDDDIPF